MLRQGTLERTLVSDARAGDAAAFSVLFGQYHGPITGYLYRLTGDRDVADDLTQETFIKAYRALGRTAADLSFRPWLYRIATNTARSWQRRQRLRSWLPFGPGSGTPEPSDDTDFAASIGERDVVIETLRQLSPHYASILLLRHVQHLSVEETAAATGISPNNAKVRLHRARKAFAAAYTALDSDLKPTTPGEQR